ncbi:MAG: ATP-binding protein, partial [Verrucomicrobiales bacterium]
LDEGCVCTLDHGTILIRPDESATPIDDSGAPIRDNLGNIIGAVLVFRDVTEARKAELEVRRHQEHLEELVAERTRKIQRTNEQLVAEVDVRRRTEQALAYKMGMENLISTVSSLFLNLRPSAIDASIVSTLERVGSVLGIDACFIIQYAPKGNRFSRTHSWPDPPGQDLQNLASADYPWWHLRLSSDDYIYIPDVLHLPDSAAPERELLRELDISSILAIPMREGSRPIGCLALPSSGAGRQWHSEDLAVLKTISSILLSAITRKRNENEKERLQEQLAHSQKMEAVGKLSGGIAHDFNNMLLPIIGYTDMLLTTMDGDDPRADDLAEIRKAADRAASLTRQLLAFSRKQVIAKSVFDLGGAIGGMERMLRRLIGADVDLVTEPDDILIPVCADIGQIEQVVMNLVINSRHAMPEGGAIRLRTGRHSGAIEDLKLIASQADGDYAFIEVKDEGVGMDPELIARIFEPFYTTKGLDGTGLGLSVVYGIIEQHDGGIDVQSSLDRGTTFRVFLPMESTVQSESAAITSSLEGGAAGDGQRILLIEDEPSVRNFVSEALGQHGYEVLTAMSIREANQLFAENHGQFHLIFSDAVLPDGNGVDLLCEIL